MRHQRMVGRGFHMQNDRESCVGNHTQRPKQQTGKAISWH